jgi:CHAT domain-containing protein
VSFRDRARRLFDAIIDLEAGPLDSPDHAFGYAERARRAELIILGDHGLAAAGTGNAVELDAVARGITGDRALVYLVLLRDRLLRWVFRDGRSEFRPQAVSIAQVESLLDSLRQATDSSDEAVFLSDMTALYDLLLRPIEDLLPASGDLYIVPDRRLDDVPYAALLDSRRGRYLVESFATALAPTAAFVVAPPRATAPAERPGGVFSLARPFLAAGVPAVLGRQWVVGDRPAAAILASFHLEYRRGSSAVSSLRAAQLAALRAPDPETRSPLSWGAFHVNGTANGGPVQTDRN